MRIATFSKPDYDDLFDDVESEWSTESSAATRKAAATDLRAGEGFTLQLPLGGGIGRSDIIYATSQLSIMVETGIPLSKALANLGEQESNPRLRDLLRQLQVRVEAGEDFSAVLARFPRHFDPTFIALMKASEQTGTLAEMLERIVTYQRRDLETRGKVIGALAYPLVLLCIACAVTLFLLTYLMPKFSPIFIARGLKLPRPTRMLMALSDNLHTWWYVWLIVTGLLVGGFCYVRSTSWGRRLLDLTMLRVPLIGGLIQKAVLSRCLRTLATLIQSGVSMIDSLRLTAEVSGNTHFASVWLRVCDEVTQGRKICESLQGQSFFPTSLVQMIASGEESGKLDRVLNRVSEFYDRELEISLKTTTAMIEPLMIVVMGVIVGGIALSLMLPIFQLSRPSG